jgi:hypothetical protein
MVIDETKVLVCPACGNRTPHKLVFQHEHVGTWYGSDGTISDGQDPASIYTVFECATCHDISLYEHLEPLGFDDATLLYPQGDSLHKSVPAQVASNFSEAKRIQTISPNAFAVLVRRALEAVCDDRGVAQETLAKRLAALAHKGEIPPVLAEISSVLRTLGNSGAHNTTQGVTVPMTWAMDEFFRALVEYVYVAPFRLQEFKKKSGSIGTEGATEATGEKGS